MKEEIHLRSTESKEKKIKICVKEISIKFTNISCFLIALCVERRVSERKRKKNFFYEKQQIFFFSWRIEREIKCFWIFFYSLQYGWLFYFIFWPIISLHFFPALSSSSSDIIFFCVCCYQYINKYINRWMGEKSISWLPMYK